MIKVDKDLTAIPVSLIPAFADLFPERLGKRLVQVPRKCNTTHTRRMEIINACKYTNNDNYNSRYKQNDIRNALNDIYNGKCAFCEQNEELTHVEHYRPKDIYFWLAYSWDNLLLSCPTCNVNKGVNFELSGTRVVFNNTEPNIRNINTCSAAYDVIEIPKMVNPEITDPEGEIYFEKKGTIKSDNPRFSYTIEKCKIDRDPLNDKRRALIDRFREHIRDVFITNESKHNQLVAIETNIRNFINDSKNKNENFLAFRKYAVSKGWLNDIIKELA